MCIIYIIYIYIYIYLYIMYIPHISSMNSLALGTASLRWALHVAGCGAPMTAELDRLLLMHRRKNDIWRQLATGLWMFMGNSWEF
jgi:hypothetical protein